MCKEAADTKERIKFSSGSDGVGGKVAHSTRILDERKNVAREEKKNLESEVKRRRSVMSSGIDCLSQVQRRAR